MDPADRVGGRTWTAPEFLATDQHLFGDAWRYELVDGRVVAHAAPSPGYGAILSGWLRRLRARWAGGLIAAGG